MTQEHLGQKMRSGALWAYLQAGGVTGLQFIAGIILARILSPADFGVFIAVTAYTALLSNQVQFGLGSALLQRKEITAGQLDTCFWFMQAIALLATLVVIAVAALLEGIYSDPRYAEVMILMCGTFFIIPYITIASTLLRREMDFKSLSKIRIIATLFSIPPSIAAALLGLGPYSLVLGGTLSAIITAWYLARRTHWRPHWFFLWPALTSLFRFAMNTNINASLDTLAERVDNMLIGALMTPTHLGLYNRAYSLARIPVEQLGLSLQTLLFGGFAKIRDDLTHTTLMYQKALCSMTLAVFPALLCFIFVADSFINTLYGDNWLDAAAPLQIMAIGAYASTVTITLRALSSAHNLVGKEVAIQIIRVLLTVILILLVASGGLQAIAMTIVLREFIVLWLFRNMIARSHIAMGWNIIAYALMPALISCSLAGLIGLSVSMAITIEWNITSVPYLLIIGSVIIGSYSICVLLLARLWKSHEMFQASIIFIIEILSRRSWSQPLARAISHIVNLKSLSK